VLSSLYPIVTIALARTVLDEQMTPRHGVGAGLALTGAAAVSTA
jgi:drug/metabolite transporter (DMT)-like permease